MNGDSLTAFAHPKPLKSGDGIRFISPASTPDRYEVEEAAELLRGWGFEVGFGKHVFGKSNYLAGTDEQRLSDLNAALRDRTIRAIFATRGGKGSYRIADRIDFAAARRDPKFLVGFSDITAIHLAFAKHQVGGGIHGAVSIEDWEPPPNPNGIPLKEILTTTNDVILRAEGDVETFDLTTSGKAMGSMVGGNLSMVATTAGWALPDLRGKILFLESVGIYLGEIDRHLAMLTKAGYLDGVAGIALGQFTDIKPSGSLTIVDLLSEYFAPLDVPILGGLPLGHRPPAQRVPFCLPTELNCEERRMTVRRQKRVSAGQWKSA